MRPDTLQTICQIIVVIGGMIAALGGYGSYHFGKKVDQVKEATAKVAQIESVARQLMLASIDIGSNYARLQICSPFARGDLRRYVERRGGKMTEDQQEYLNAVGKNPDFSKTWALRTDDRVLSVCSEIFISSRLPTIDNETRVLVSQWPSPGDSDFPYVDRLGKLKVFKEWIDEEGESLIGRDSWEQMRTKLMGNATDHTQAHDILKQRGFSVGHMVDEGPMSDPEFKHGIIKIKGGESIFFIDLLLDTAFKLKDGQYYQFQGRIGDSNEPRGYLKIRSVPQDILNFETLTGRTTEQIERDRQEWTPQPPDDTSGKTKK